MHIHTVTMLSSEKVFCFCLGESFSTYHNLQAKVKNYDRLAAVQLTHQDSWNIEGMKSCAPNRVKEANPQIVYYGVYLSCVFGRKNYKNKVSGQKGAQ